MKAEERWLRFSEYLLGEKKARLDKLRLLTNMMMGFGGFGMDAV